MRNRVFLWFETTPFLLRLCLLWIALPVHWIWKWIAWIRWKGYRKGFFSSYSSKKPVIAVGNLTCGGTGKTPFVVLLAKELVQKGYTVGVLTRGYHSPMGKTEGTLVCQGKGVLYSAAEIGDEPYLLCKKLPHIWCYVGKNRLKALQILEDKVDVFVLDDGLQYLKVRPSLQVLMEGELSWGDRHFFLPIGRLRDITQRKKEADVIVGKFGLQISWKISRWLSVETGKEVHLPKGEKVALFCAIASPHRFVKSVEKTEMQIMDVQFFSDHHFIQQKWICDFMQKNSTIKACICTEKDAVKLERKEKLPLPLLAAELEAKIESPLIWDLFIEKIVSSINNCGN